MRTTWILPLALLLLGCPATEEAEPPPDFNFIPLHDDVCEPTTEAELDSARAALDGLVLPADGRTDWIVQELALCGPDSCAPCDSNPLKQLFDALDAEDWFVEGVPADYITMSSADYVDRALQYPARDLVAQVQQTDGLGLLVLAEAREMSCAWQDGEDLVDCGHHALQIESLASDCQSAPLAMLGTWSESGDEATIAATGTNPFGFVVPIVTDWPDPGSFDSAHDLQGWVSAQQRLEVRGTEPQVTVRQGSEGGCFSMSQQVPVANLFEFWAEDADKMARLGTLIVEQGIPVTGDTIELKLSGVLEPATLTNGAPAALEGGAR